MDALVPAFVVAGLLELGDSTQFLAMLLGARFRAPLAVLAGILLAALANMALGAAAGTLIALEINHRAILLMTGLSLILAGGGAQFRVTRPDPVDSWRLGAFLSPALAFFILALFDKTQFVAATISAASGQPVATTIGAAAGITAANAPAVLLGERWPRIAPLRAIRIAIGALLVIAGLYLAFGALGLI
ncbi:MAG TPA: TMEM165/GDT1 family protein [Sphingomonas sp.]